MNFTKSAFSVGAILMLRIAFVEPVQLALPMDRVNQDFKIGIAGRAAITLSLSGGGAG